eukprot:CAMPEP_0173097558 /NCGR_PEP_ID=MMETSP1102-20130122/34006_1 /TAXON_ID=49646 /ORGANISM="Geminigera sp., Strain Caron Lab Isolate" /LENGTH=453 /DNA_ID=CAMNT_0013989485 /DNA_START=155 /DNA_END=1514 /DNA_ORIENTATION=+
MLSMLNRRKKTTGNSGTWDVKVYVRAIESIPHKYTRLKIEFRESKGRKASVSEEIFASNGQVDLNFKPLAIWQQHAPYAEAANGAWQARQIMMNGKWCMASPTNHDDLSSLSLSQGSGTAGSEGIDSHSTFESQFFRLALLRINPRAVRERQKCIGSTLLDMAQYASYQATRSEYVTLLLAVSNAPPAKVELMITTRWLARGGSPLESVTPAPSLSLESPSFYAGWDASPLSASPPQDATEDESEQESDPENERDTSSTAAAVGAEAHMALDCNVGKAALRHNAPPEEETQAAPHAHQGSLTLSSAIFSSRPASSTRGRGCGEVDRGVEPPATTTQDIHTTDTGSETTSSSASSPPSSPPQTPPLILPSPMPSTISPSPRHPRTAGGAAPSRSTTSTHPQPPHMHGNSPIGAGLFPGTDLTRVPAFSVERGTHAHHSRLQHTTTHCNALQHTA